MDVTNSNLSVRSLSDSEDDIEVKRKVQSSFLKLFWFGIWKLVYLSFVNYLELDLWLLSRAISRRAKAVLLILPAFFLLFLVISSSSSYVFSLVIDSVSTMISSLFLMLGKVSLIGILFNQEKVTVSETSWLSSPVVETSHRLGKQNVEDVLSVSDLDAIPKSLQSRAEELLALNKLQLSFQQMEGNKVTYQKLENDIRDLELKFEVLFKSMSTKEKDSVEKYQKVKSVTNEKIIAISKELKNHIDSLENKLENLEAKLGTFEDYKKCCKDGWNQKILIALIEKNIIFAFKSVLGGSTDSKYSFFREWLTTNVFNTEKIMQDINGALKGQSSHTEAVVKLSEVLQIIESTVLKHVEALKKNFVEFYGYNSYSSFPSDNDYLSEDKIKRIIKEAIMLYDADKLGQVDYALESGGGSVVSIRCSETYEETSGKIILLGVPFWTYSNSPSTAIQPDVYPGRCWAFKGSQGFLVLKLSAIIYPTGFTLEHIPVSISPAGSIDSAPKNFSVWGLEFENDNKGFLFGKYFYDINGDPLQYFAVKIKSDKPYSYIELQVHSNHGNIDYTCLYRFRVHGKRAQ